MTDGLEVKSNKELFDRWRQLGLDVSALAGMVQNDMTVSGDQIVDWVGFSTTGLARFGALFADTLKHLGYYKHRLTVIEGEDDPVVIEVTPEQIEGDHGGF